MTYNVFGGTLNPAQPTLPYVVTVDSALALAQLLQHSLTFLL